MNVAIEYILRNGRVERMLSLPCSLFLENNKNKVVLTLNRCYGSDNIIVRQYDIMKIGAFEILPNYKESLIPFDKIFTNPNTILEGFNILEFKEQPFNSEEKQIAELPLSAIQERKYNEHLITFFSPKILNHIRENWLWMCFENLHVSMEIKKKLDFCTKTENFRELIIRNDKSYMKLWEIWKKHLLLNSNPAAELVFAKYYKSKFLKKEAKPKKEIIDDCIIYNGHIDIQLWANAMEKMNQLVVN